MNELQDKALFLERKNKELQLELKKKKERLKELEITVKVLKRMNGDS